jgi:hypothetical protein
MRFSFLIPVVLITGNIFCQTNEVVFREDFEEPSIKELVSSWDDVKNSEGMFFSKDVPSGSKGKQSLVMTYIAGENTGGHLYKMLPLGYDSLYVRFYVKFSPDHSKVHHFVHLGGYNPPTKWPHGGAGIRPEGKERFTTGIEPIGERWSWDFYTYWMHMRGCAQPGKYWGNIFNPNPPAPVKRGEWICVEMMMKMNDPVESFNGEQAFWINGKKVLHLGKGFPHGHWKWDQFHPGNDTTTFEGFQWRKEKELRINMFWLLYYMTDGEPGRKDSVWFDDVVISESYIGSLKH